ncbi:MAG: D-cysteine desulfhydrase family protein [Dehalococcoidia bacterium]|nr:D-cysteine desulfhydrase family protein [Dehalococcoidia bacterium]
MKLEELGRLKLCTLPTPLMEAPQISAKLGGPRILIKRDDLTGLAMGGNKSRPLEFLMAESKKNGDDIVVTAGYQQSNWVCNIIAAARKLGMDVILFLLKGSGRFQGNLLLYKLLGADLRFTDMEVRDLPALYKQMDSLAAELRRQGRRPHVIYYESFGPVGIASYVMLVSEICQQLQEKGLTAQYLFHTSGSGCTQAGLLVGARYFKAPFEVVGVMPNHRYTREQRVRMVADLASATSQFLDMNFSFSPEEVKYYDEYAGESYSAPTKKGIEAIKLVASTEGIFLDPIYSSKSMACLIDQIRDGRFKPQDTVIYYHSGGLPQLFFYNEELTA